MHKFKVGDRVKMRGFANIGGESADVDNRKGTVTKLHERMGRLVVQRDGDTWEIEVYPSQCRHLKRRREIWIAETAIPGPLRSSHAVVSAAELVGEQYVRFREVSVKDAAK